MQRLLTIDEVAERLRVCSRTVRNYLKEGLLSYVQLPGKRKKLIPEAELHRLLAEFKRNDSDNERKITEVVESLLP